MDDDVVKSEDSLLAERALKKIEIHEKCEIMKLQWCEREDEVVLQVLDHCKLNIPYWFLKSKNLRTKKRNSNAYAGKQKKHKYGSGDD